MEIIKQSQEFTGAQRHKLTKGKNPVKVKDAVGLEIRVSMWVLYTDTDAKGEDFEVLSIMADDGTVYTTISETFKRSFFDILEDFAGEDLPDLVILEGTSKNNRTYYDCDIVY